MTKQLLKKSGRLVIKLLSFSLILHMLLYLSTGDPVLIFLRKKGLESANHSLIIKIRHDLGLQGNYTEQYWHWLSKIIKGDFGTSFMKTKPVLNLVLEKLSISLMMLLPALLLSAVLAIISGAILANSKIEKIRLGFNHLFVVISSFPVYWIALVLIFLFSIELNWLPFVGSQTSWQLILPVLSLVLCEGTYLSKMIMDLYYKEANSQSQKIASFRGLHWFYSFRYQSRAISIPVLTLIANSAIHLIGLSLIVENIFSISGLGQLLLDAILFRDYPLIQCIVLLIAIFTFSVHYLLDLFILISDKRLSQEFKEISK